jgi:hypothetical protein
MHPVLYHALLMIYSCFTHALLMILLVFYWCFTGALLVLYWCFTGALLVGAGADPYECDMIGHNALDRATVSD